MMERISMVIERGILRAFVESEPGSNQEDHARRLLKYYEELVEGGFKDPSPLSKENDQEINAAYEPPSAYHIDGGRITYSPDDRSFSVVDADSKEPRTEWLTLRENELFRILVVNANKVVKKSYIFNEIWGEETSEYSEIYVKKYVQRLRRKLEPDIKDPKKLSMIVSARGVGYKLKASVNPIY